MASEKQEKGKLDISEPPLPMPPNTRWDWVKNHLTKHRPFYVWLPVGVAAVWASIRVYEVLTKRSPIDDVPVGALWNLVGMIAVVILTNNTKPRLFDDIDTRDPKLPWWRCLIDSCETAFLLWLFAYFILR